MRETDIETRRQGDMRGGSEGEGKEERKRRKTIREKEISECLSREDKDNETSDRKKRILTRRGENETDR